MMESFFVFAALFWFLSWAGRVLVTVLRRCSWVVAFGVFASLLSSIPAPTAVGLLLGIIILLVAGRIQHHRNTVREGSESR